MTHADGLSHDELVKRARAVGILWVDDLRLPRTDFPVSGIAPQPLPIDTDAFLEYAREIPGARTNAGYRNCTQWFFPRGDLGPRVRERGEALLSIVRSAFRVCLDRYAAEVQKNLWNRRYLTHVEWPSIVRYEAARADAFHAHADNWSAASALRQFALIVYLNDVTEDGETVFPELGIEVAPRAGRAIFFPAFATHAHRAIAPRSGDKWVLVAWLRYPDLPEGERVYGPGFPLDP